MIANNSSAGHDNIMTCPSLQVIAVAGWSVGWSVSFQHDICKSERLLHMCRVEYFAESYTIMLRDERNEEACF